MSGHRQMRPIPLSRLTGRAIPKPIVRGAGTLKRCHHCLCANVRTVDSRPYGDFGTRRKKVCGNCGKQWWTVEVIEGGPDA